MTEWLWVGDNIRPLLRTKRRTVALDLETAGLSFKDEVLGISIAWRTSRGGMRSSYLKAPTGQMSMDDPIMERGVIDIQRFIREIYKRHYAVFHNEVFDSRGLYRLNPKASPSLQTHDTKHLAGLVAWQEEKSLRWLYHKYVGKSLPKQYRDMKRKRGKLSQMPLYEVQEYARTDAVNTLELFEVLYRKMEEVIDPHYYNRDRKYAAVVMQMVHKGMKLDFGWCQDKERQFRERMFIIEGYLRQMGLHNPASNVDVATFLFETQKLPTSHSTRTSVKTARWPEGVPSVAKGVLEKLEDYDESVKLIIEWRQLSSAISKWLYEFREHASVDGRIHALLDPFGTISARMAASEPNVQAIPMDDRGTAFGSMKGILKGSGGKYKLYGIDFSQAEARLAAVMARESALIKIFNSGEDPYVQMSERIWYGPGKRDMAKRATLASIYDVGADKFAATWNLRIEEADAILRAFRRSFPRLRLASQLTAQLAEANGRIDAYNGRPRWFGPDEAAYKAFNQKVQMTVAEIMKEAILGVDRALPGILRLQVHDSLVVETNRKYSGGNGILAEIQEIMDDSVPDEFRVIQFPTKVDIWQ